LVGFIGEQGSMLSIVLIKCVHSYKNENPPNRILNRFFELNSVKNKMQLESESSSRIFPIFFLIAGSDLSAREIIISTF